MVRSTAKINLITLTPSALLSYVSYKIKFGATLLGVEVVALEVGQRDEKVDEDEEQEGGHEQRENE